VSYFVDYFVAYMYMYESIAHHLAVEHK